jgi:predicted  nucleic acid-binding Zn-ribbon protein
MYGPSVSNTTPTELRQAMDHSVRDFTNVIVDRAPLFRHMYRLPTESLSLYNQHMSRTSSLYALQRIDFRSHEISVRQHQISAILEESERVGRAQAHVDQAQSELVAARAKTHAAEQEVASQKAKIDRNQNALYGGSVQNPKELRDLQLESQSLQRHLDTLEDQLLEWMLQLEEVEGKYQGAREDLDVAVSETQAQHKDLLEERQRLEAEVERLMAEREAALASVGPEELAQYEKIKQNVGPMAMALLDEGACSACGLALPGSEEQRVRGGDELVRCRQCGRILYAG